MKENIEREAAIHAVDKVGKALDVAGAFYAQGYHDAMTDHNLVERKRGEWVLKERAHYFKCSLCKEPIPYKFGYADSRRYYNFCPNCGADMRGEKHD